jgi:magnesium-protoporphyrin IX monomethyl ester (oxidative) cyclase
MNVQAKHSSGAATAEEAIALQEALPPLTNEDATA